jgi:hypothetical protein
MRPCGVNTASIYSQRSHMLLLPSVHHQLRRSLLSPRYSLRIDYIIPLQSLIAMGAYDHVDADLALFNDSSSNASVSNIVVELFHLRPTLYSSDEIVAALQKSGYRPITLRELLFLGAFRPRLQQRFTIIALGSTAIETHWHVRLCAGLSSDSAPYSLPFVPGRHLRQFCFELPWQGRHRFGAVKES